MNSVALTNQWNDFLLREVDPYAAKKYEILLDWLGSIDHKEVLVVGSGSGELAALLARKQAHVTAIDIDSRSVDLTKKTAKKFNVNINTEISQIENFNAKILFDIVLATDVIEHIQDDAFAVEKIYNFLKPQGKVVITVPALSFLFGYHDEVLGHYRRYSKLQLTSLLKNKFEITHCRFYGFLLIPVALVISRWLRRPYPVKEVGDVSLKEGFIPQLIRFIFSFEKFISVPMGTSLLLVGKKK